MQENLGKIDRVKRKFIHRYSSMHLVKFHVNILVILLPSVAEK
jgi:hypothetical protein